MANNPEITSIPGTRPSIWGPLGRGIGTGVSRLLQDFVARKVNQQATARDFESLRNIGLSPQHAQGIANIQDPIMKRQILTNLIKQQASQAGQEDTGRFFNQLVGQEQAGQQQIGQQPARQQPSARKRRLSDSESSRRFFRNPNISFKDKLAAVKAVKKHEGELGPKRERKIRAWQRTLDVDRPTAEAYVDMDPSQLTAVIRSRGFVPGRKAISFKEFNKIMAAKGRDRTKAEKSARKRGYSLREVSDDKVVAHYLKKAKGDANKAIKLAKKAGYSVGS